MGRSRACSPTSGLPPHPQAWRGSLWKTGEMVAAKESRRWWVWLGRTLMYPLPWVWGSIVGQRVGAGAVRNLPLCPGSAELQERH